MAYLSPGGGLAILRDIAGRKEFFATHAESAGPLALPGLRLSGAQLFVRNFLNPDTEYTRLLVNWQTGTGKSIASIAIGNEFVRQYRARAALGEVPPTVTIISFTAKETIQEDMLRHPEFGFVSAAEVEELRSLRAAAQSAGAGSPEVRTLAGLLGTLRRRVTDRSRGGYYQFFGYKEFANRLFALTARGGAEKYDLWEARGEEFGTRLADAVRRGYIDIGQSVIDSLRGGLLICDEIHNVYNITESNNYGTAIQYVLDTIDDLRAVAMSATPMTGSAGEVVDLLNFLVPRDGAPLMRRSDFFTRVAAPGDEDSAGFVVSQLKEGALDRIAQLAAGRVSFLLDADTRAYPRRIFEGEAVAGIPYLKFVECPMSPLHARTLAAEQASTAGLAAGSYTLYDMVFPNPAGGQVGLFRSADTAHLLAQAPEAWCAEKGVYVERGAEAGLSAGTYLITGPFLEAPRLAEYSAKYSRLLRDIIAAVEAGPGKIMVYHNRVRMSGVLILQEILRMNGFADRTSAPTENTRCGICGVVRRLHGTSQSASAAAHDYTPARFVVAHSDVDRTEMVRSIALFNSPTNPDGYQVRILLGSKIIREGWNFKSVRFLFVCSMPTDVPTLIQVFGRVVRKESHAELPPDRRDVRIRVYVTSGGPEIKRYADKGREYLVIQEVERALRRYAVDGFANYPRIRRIIGDKEASLDSLPYRPADLGPAQELRTATFEGYGHGDREVATIAAACRVLFQARRVWTYADLWGAVRSGAVRLSYDTTLFDEGNFALALESLKRAYGKDNEAVVQAGPYYIYGTGEPDIETYLRAPCMGAEQLSYPIADYLKVARSGQNFIIRLRDFNAKYLGPDATAPLELALIEHSTSFHQELLARLVTTREAAVTLNDAKVIKLYRRFRILFTAADARARLGANYRGAADGPAGYATPESVTLYDGAAWYSAPLAAFGIGRRQAENNIVVGFVMSNPAQPMVAKFKIRPPSHVKPAKRAEKTDSRSLFRGAVCETRPRVELKKYVESLRAVLLRKKSGGGEAAPAPLVDPAADFDGEPVEVDEWDMPPEAFPEEIDGFPVGYAARHILQRFPSAGEMCLALRLTLLALEEQARAKPDGLRWLYLFPDRLPALTL